MTQILVPWSLSRILSLTVRFSILALPILFSGCGGVAGRTPPVKPAPTVSVSASPASITAGNSSTLTVTATNASQVTLTGTDGSTYNLQPQGGRQAVSPAATTTYTTAATGAGGHVSASTTVTVVTQTQAPTVDITANPASIASGNSSTLTVTATNASQVTLTGTDGTTYNLQPHGGRQAVSPAATTT